MICNHFAFCLCVCDFCACVCVVYVRVFFVCVHVSAFVSVCFSLHAEECQREGKKNKNKNKDTYVQRLVCQVLSNQIFGIMVFSILQQLGQLNHQVTPTPTPVSQSCGVKCYLDEFRFDLLTTNTNSCKAWRYKNRILQYVNI